MYESVELGDTLSRQRVYPVLAMEGITPIIDYRTIGLMQCLKIVLHFSGLEK
jgi:hypothetical protein